MSMSQSHLADQPVRDGLADTQDESLIQNRCFDDGQLGSFDYANDFLPELGFANDLQYTPSTFTFDVTDFDHPSNEPSDMPHTSLGDARISPPTASLPPKELTVSKEANDGPSPSPRSTKRMRDGATPDVLQACWNSPLCPQSDKILDGHPDPSTCEGACLPFLFPPSPDSDTQALADLPQTPIEYDMFANQVDLSALQSVDLTSVPTPDGIVDCDKAETQAPFGPSAAGSKQARQQPRRVAKVKPEPVNVDTLSESVTEASSKSPKSRTKGRMPHNQVERKYRESLNTQLEALRRVVPSLRNDGNGQTNAQPDGADIEDMASTSLTGKPSKALILANATTYIKHLERERQREQAEIARLKERMAVMSRLLSVGVKSNAGGCGECQVLDWVRGMNLNEDPGSNKIKER